MLNPLDPEWTRHGHMKVARWVDPELVKRVYAELVRLERRFARQGH